MKALFDASAYARQLRVRVAELRIDGYVAAAQIGISPSALCRIQSGKTPTVEKLLTHQSMAL